MPFRSGDTKFEVDTCNLSVTAAEEEQIKAFLAWYNNLKSTSAIRHVEAKENDGGEHGAHSTACTAKNAPCIVQKPWVVQPPGPFRLLDLPPEMRLRIYTHVFEVDQPEGWQLPTMAFPSITRVSQLVRKESLPAFFTEARFKISVASDVWRFFPDRHWSPSGNQVGVLHLNQKVKKAIQAAGNVALFKDVEFVLCYSWLKRYAERGVPDALVVAMVRLHVYKGNLTVDVVRGRAWPEENTSTLASTFTSMDYPKAYRRYEHMLENVRNLANKISMSRNFKGFAWKDLAKIAKGFQCKRGSPAGSDDDA